VLPASGAGFLDAFEVFAAQPEGEAVAVVAAPAEDGDFLAGPGGAELAAFEGHRTVLW